MQARAPISHYITNLALVFCAAIFLPGCSTAPANKSMNTAKTFRVMTYNIHHGEGLDGKIDLLRIAEVIKREGADIMALQEVDKGVERTARRDLPAELAALTGMTAVFSNNHPYQGGEYGNAILTRFTVKSWTNSYYKMLRPGEQRGLLQLVLDVHGSELVFMNTHIDYRGDDSERLMNIPELHTLAKGYGGRPMIVCGDFNDTPGSRTYLKMKEQFRDTWELIGKGDGLSYPAEKPNKRIDYIWLSQDAALEPLKAWIPQTDASDHLPVVGEFSLR